MSVMNGISIRRVPDPLLRWIHLDFTCVVVLNEYRVAVRTNSERLADVLLKSELSNNAGAADFSWDIVVETGRTEDYANEESFSSTNNMLACFLGTGSFFSLDYQRHYGAGFLCLTDNKEQQHKQLDRYLSLLQRATLLAFHDRTHYEVLI
jgi:hypothetical protein